MNQSSVSQYLWLLGIMAACAAPFAALSGTSESSRANAPKSADQAASASEETSASETATTGEQPADGDELENLLWQALAGKVPQREIGEQMQRLHLDVVVATVSDPANSRFPVDFDQTVEALELAATRMGYVHDRFSFPWPRRHADRAKLLKHATYQKRALEYPEHTGFQGRPGILLFRRAEMRKNKLAGSAGSAATRADDAQGAEPLQTAEYLVLLLVAETSTTGIDPLAFQQALDWYARYDWRYRNPESRSPRQRADEPKHPPTVPGIRLLGPRYSGSQRSLKQALEAWHAQYRESGQTRRLVFDVLSGSASAVIPEVFEKTADPGLDIRFSATVQQSKDLRRHLDDFVRQAHSGGLFRGTELRIAWLVEAYTGFGALATASEEGEPELTDEAVSQPPADSRDDEEILQFPLHISQVFETYKKQGLLNDKIKALSEALHQGLNLPTDTLDGVTDVTPNYDEQMSAVYADLELARIMRAIAAGDFDYVGIVATDVRDRVFLSQMIAKHCPDARLTDSCAPNRRQLPWGQFGYEPSCILCPGFPDSCISPIVIRTA